MAVHTLKYTGAKLNELLDKLNAMSRDGAFIRSTLSITPTSTDEFNYYIAADLDASIDVELVVGDWVVDINGDIYTISEKDSYFVINEIITPIYKIEYWGNIKGPQGEHGIQGEPGYPENGTTGQLLTKTDDGVAWVDNPSIPAITEYGGEYAPELRGQFYTQGTEDTPPVLETQSVSIRNASYAIARRGSGGTLSIGEPINSEHATTKNYVDNAVSNAVYVKGGKEIITVGTVIHAGATIYIDYDKIANHTHDGYDGSGGQFFYAGAYAGSSTCDYGWNTEGYPWSPIDGGSIDSPSGIVSFVYSGETCTITTVWSDSESMFLQEDLNFYRKTDDGEAETIELTADMVGAATEEYVDNAIENIKIPEGVATESYVDEKIGEIGEVLDSINADLSAI